MFLELIEVVTPNLPNTANSCQIEFDLPAVKHGEDYLIWERTA